VLHLTFNSSKGITDVIFAPYSLARIIPGRLHANRHSRFHPFRSSCSLPPVATSAEAADVRVQKGDVYYLRFQSSEALRYSIPNTEKDDPMTKQIGPNLSKTL
jgi:hypothetical protein